MLTRLRALAPRALPNGWPDVVRQVLIFAAAYYAYRLVRGAVDGHTRRPRSSTRGTSSGSSARCTCSSSRPCRRGASEAVDIDFASWMYVNAHLPLMIGSLIWLYIFRNRSLLLHPQRLRDLDGHRARRLRRLPDRAAAPVPRVGLRGLGLELRRLQHRHGVGDERARQPVRRGAVVHVCFALIIGISMSRLVRPKWADKLRWSLYPSLMTFVVIVTANHWWMDAVLGALTALVAATIAQALLARARPNDWAFAGARI